MVKPCCSDLRIIKANIYRNDPKFSDTLNIAVNMPPASKKLTGHIGFELCMHPSVHPFACQELCMLGF